MPASDQSGAGENRQRLDKWLWFARIVKTRQDSQRLVESGHVRINSTKVTKPGHGVKPGDVLTIVLNARVRVLRVEAFTQRRGEATAARLLYAEPNAMAPGMPSPEGDPPQKEGASDDGSC